MGQPIRAVIDTSSLVPPGLRRELQQAAQLGAFTALWSPWIIAELNRVLTWRWLSQPAPGCAIADLSAANARRCGAAARAMMQLLIASFELVNPRPPYPTPWPSLPDVWDHPIWAAAKAGAAQLVISENTRHFPPRQPDGRHRYEGVEYLRAQEFLRRLTEE